MCAPRFSIGLRVLAEMFWVNHINLGPTLYYLAGAMQPCEAPAVVYESPKEMLNGAGNRARTRAHTNERTHTR